MYCNGSLMWSREIKHTKRCKTERKNVADIGSYHTKRKRECWYRTSSRRRRAEYTNNNAQRYGPKALIRRANDGRKNGRQQESAMRRIWILLILSEGKSRDRDLVYGPTPFACHCGKMGSASSKSRNSCAKVLTTQTCNYKWVNKSLPSMFHLFEVCTYWCQSTVYHFSSQRCNLVSCSRSSEDPSSQICVFVGQNLLPPIFGLFAFSVPLFGYLVFCCDWVISTSIIAAVWAAKFPPITIPIVV